jgi:hypothetical protein
MDPFFLIVTGKKYIPKILTGIAIAAILCEEMHPHVLSDHKCYKRVYTII